MQLWCNTPMNLTLLHLVRDQSTITDTVGNNTHMILAQASLYDLLARLQLDSQMSLHDVCGRIHNWRNRIGLAHQCALGLSCTSTTVDLVIAWIIMTEDLVNEPIY